MPDAPIFRWRPRLARLLTFFPFDGASVTIANPVLQRLPAECFSRGIIPIPNGEGILGARGNDNLLY
jgi:hypothetical protein